VKELGRGGGVGCWKEEEKAWRDGGKGGHGWGVVADAESSNDRTTMKVLEEME